MIATNPTAIPSRIRARRPRFTASVIDFYAGSRLAPFYRDQVSGPLDRIDDSLPIIYPRTSGHIRSICRLTIHRPGHGRFTRDRYTTHATPDGVRLLRSIGRRGRIHTQRVNRAFAGSDDRIVVRYYDEALRFWAAKTLTGWEIAAVLDWLADHPDALALSHLTWISPGGRIVPLGTDLVAAYERTGLLVAHPLDVDLRRWLGGWAMAVVALNADARSAGSTLAGYLD